MEAKKEPASVTDELLDPLIVSIIWGPPDMESDA
jgi:hypothetical protein